MEEGREAAQSQPCAAREPISRAGPDAEPSAARAAGPDPTDLFEALEAGLVEGAPTLALQAGCIWIDGETAFDARVVLTALAERRTGRGLYRCTRPDCGRNEIDCRENGCARGPCPMEFVG